MVFSCLKHGDFNSIKVRLELPLLCFTLFSSTKFQFHKGTIRTSDEPTEVFPVKLFQFHKGTIRTYGQYRHGHNQVDFNSIKVRLERLLDLTLISFLTVFQFHKGTIRTVIQVAVSIQISNFNSIKVRLELSPYYLDRILQTFQFHKGTIRTLCSCSRTYRGS